MSKEDQFLEKYKIALKITLNEGRVLWSFSQSFLLANTIIFAFISQRTTNQNILLSRNPDLWLFLLSLVGFSITGLWFLAYIRRSDYYKFRVAQLRNIEPNEWGFIKGKGKDFSDGKEVWINNEKYQLSFLGRIRT